LKTDSGYSKDMGVSHITVQSVLLPAKTYLGGGMVFLGLIHQISLHKHWHLKKNCSNQVPSLSSGIPVACLLWKKKCEHQQNHYLLGHSHGWDQRLFDIGNLMFINWSPGKMNSKIIGVWVQSKSNFIPIIKIPLPTSGIQNYGVATVSRINKMIGLFCRILSLLWGSFAKETCNFIDPTNLRHPINIYPLVFLARKDGSKQIENLWGQGHCGPWAGRNSPKSACFWIYYVK